MSPCCWPQHLSLSRPVPFTSFTVCWRKGGTRPARADALPCPAFLPSLRAIMPHLPFLRTSEKSGKNTISSKVPPKNSRAEPVAWRLREGEIVRGATVSCHMFLPRKYLLVVADPSSSHPGTLSVVVPALRALAAACDDISKVTRDVWPFLFWR